MAEILPRDLSAVPSVNPSSAIIVDDGNIVGKATPLQVVDSARPKASQVDAETGADNEKIMTPLRVKQAIDARAAIQSSLSSNNPGDGASLIGLEGRGTVQDAIGYITPEMYGAFGLEDDTAKFSQMLDDAEALQKAIYFSAGSRVRIDSNLRKTNAFVRMRSEPGGVIDFSNGGRLRLEPGVTPLPSLSGNVAADGFQFTFTSSHGLSVNDVFVVWNPDDYSQGSVNAYEKAGRMYQVAEVVSPTSVIVWGTSRKPWVSSDVEVFRLNGESARIEGFTVVPPSIGVNPVFWLDGFANSSLRDMEMPQGAQNLGFDIFRCYDFHIEGMRSTVTSGQGYSCMIANSQNGNISGVRGLRSTRHCIALGGRPDVATPPTSDILISDAILEHNPVLGIGAADMHGGTENITYDNCILTGAIMAGKNQTYRNCTIYGRPSSLFPDGMCLYGSAVVGGTYTVENNRFVTWGNPGTYGVMHFGIDGLAEPFQLIARNNTILCHHENPISTRCIRFDVGTDDHVHPITVEVDGLAYYANAPGIGAVSFVGSAALAGGSSISLQSASLPQGMPRMHSQNNANFGMAWRAPSARPGVTMRGQANTTLAAASDTVNNLWESDFGTNRTATLDTAHALTGDRFVLSRTGGNLAGGPYVLNITPAGGSPIATLAQDEWAEVVCNRNPDGSATWFVSSRGSLA